MLLISIQRFTGQVFEMQTHVVPAGEIMQRGKRIIRSGPVRRGIDLPKAKLHGIRVNVHAERVWREMIEMMKFKARNVRRDLEPGSAKVLIELIVTRATSPFEDPSHAFLDQVASLVPFQAPALLTPGYEVLCAVGKHLAASQQVLDPFAGLRIE